MKPVINKKQETPESITYTMYRAVCKGDKLSPVLGISFVIDKAQVSRMAFPSRFIADTIRSNRRQLAIDLASVRANYTGPENWPIV